MKLEEFVLKHVDDGLLLCLLEDDQGGKTHCVGINMKKRIIYDYMEAMELHLSKDNLSLCCGDNTRFVRFNLIVQVVHYGYKH